MDIDPSDAKAAKTSTTCPPLWCCALIDPHPDIYMIVTLITWTADTCTPLPTIAINLWPVRRLDCNGSYTPSHGSSISRTCRKHVSRWIGFIGSCSTSTHTFLSFGPGTQLNRSSMFSVMSTVSSWALAQGHFLDPTLIFRDAPNVCILTIRASPNWWTWGTLWQISSHGRFPTIQKTIWTPSF